ncbi:MAG TPA: class I SAM-dependent methyltransferase [Polyangiaceae bacterium]|nr:class I SAM-dependent methyltransferase [Polyangiaceae bacterium]
MPEDESYYTHARPEVLRLVPEGARHVLDVGCGAGALGASIKRAFPQAQVRGVELVSSAAEQARGRLDAVSNADATAPLPVDWPAPDVLVFADVLEHLVDPWQALQSWRQRAAPGCHLVVSLPNVSHASVVSGLQKGQFRYADEGLLDRTHLRFFTRESAIELVEAAGFHIERFERVISIPGPGIKRTLLKGLVQAQYRREQRDQSWRSAPHGLLDTVTFQFLVQARAESGGR